MRDGTMTLCTTCHRAIYCWRNVPLPGIQGEIMGDPPYWSHIAQPVNHDANPMVPFFDRDRTLACANCRRPQEWHRGWFCPTCDHT